MRGLMASSTTLERVKSVIRCSLRLNPGTPVEDAMPLIGGEYDMDSLDILLVITNIEKEFGIQIQDKRVGREAFTSVNTLADFVESFQAAASREPEVSPMAGPDLHDRLPHQPPFRFLSRVLEHEPGVSGVGVWGVTGSEEFFAGHFPGKPVVPGVLLAEALAQLAGIVAFAGDVEELRLAHLAQVNVKFLAPVVPPAEITLRARVVRALGALRVMDVRAESGGVEAASGQVTLAVVRAREGLS